MAKRLRRFLPGDKEVGMIFLLLIPDRIKKFSSFPSPATPQEMD